MKDEAVAFLFINASFDLFSGGMNKPPHFDRISPSW